MLQSLRTRTRGRRTPEPVIRNDLFSFAGRADRDIGVFCSARERARRTRALSDLVLGTGSF
jgi:hypothetical protein